MIYSVQPLSIGHVLIARNPIGVTHLYIGDSVKKLLLAIHESYPTITFVKDNEDVKLNKYFKLLESYLSGKSKSLKIPLSLNGTDFQTKVWDELQKIPFGQKLSYSELAEKIGKPTAHRAVASACAKNNVAIIVPCHRVIGKNSKLSGYRWGLPVKEKLLNLESK